MPGTVFEAFESFIMLHENSTTTINCFVVISKAHHGHCPPHLRYGPGFPGKVDDLKNHQFVLVASGFFDHMLCYSSSVFTNQNAVFPKTDS